MAPKYQAHRLIGLPLACTFAAALLVGTPDSLSAHQLVNASNATVPHHHVVKRSSYGDGLIRGHVAPTRHGHNLIIWAPAPSNALGRAAPNMQFVRPQRQLHSHPRRISPTNEQLRKLNPRPDRR